MDHNLDHIQCLCHRLWKGKGNSTSKFQLSYAILICSVFTHLSCKMFTKIETILVQKNYCTVNS